MITVHHLNDSRSQRVLWLLEELGLPYEVRRYRRDPETNLAPPELRAVHPLGKSPAVVDEGRVMIESGAIVENLVRRHGGGRLRPSPDSPAHDEYVQWLHYAEGSAMLPLMLGLYASRLGDAAAPLQPRIGAEIRNHLGYVEASLQGREWLVEDAFGGADIQMSFVGEAAGARGLLEKCPAIASWVKRFQAREPWRRALERGGPYRFETS